MIPVLFEDDDILAVNKPDGMASIPERDRSKASLLGTLSEERQMKLYIVHRLDKEVSGVMLFAKNAGAHKYLNGEFFEHRVKKNYVALVHGAVERDAGVIDKPLREFGSGRVGVDPRLGKPSQTEFRVTERYGDYTLLEASPLTGRRHQLRVHFYSVGYPVVGDVRYGDRGLQSKYGRLMLHARHIGLVSPSQSIVNIEAPLPDSFQSILRTLCPSRHA